MVAFYKLSSKTFSLYIPDLVSLRSNGGVMFKIANEFKKSACIKFGERHGKCVFQAMGMSRYLFGIYSLESTEDFCVTRKQVIRMISYCKYGIVIRAVKG